MYMGKMIPMLQLEKSRNKQNQNYYVSHTLE